MRTFKKLALATTAVAFGVAGSAQAAIITTNAAAVSGVAVTSPFGPLAAGGAVGNKTIATGLDFTYGNVEGIFNDPPLAFCGINGSNVCDLLTAVDARIVTLNSLVQGLTQSVSVLAGGADPNTLTLRVFGLANNLLGSATNVAGGVSSFGVTLGSAQIAYFSVSGNDTFGVQSVSIETPVVAVNGAVPEPATWGMMLAGFGIVGGAMRRRQRTSVSFG